jgi:plasmid replication initiation protein
MNHLVKKSNALIESRMQLDLVEMRMIALVAAQIHVEDEDFKPYRVKVTELYHGTQNAYSELKTRARNILSRVIELPPDPTKKGQTWRLRQIFNKADYYEEAGELELKFDPDVKDLFLELKNRFTIYELRYALQIPSVYTFRLYELLMQYKNTAEKGKWSRTIEISEIYRMLNINKETAPSYLIFGKFKQGILEPALRHLKQFTDIQFSYKPLKISSRSYTHIEFNVKFKEQEKQTTPAPMAKLTPQEKGIQQKCWNDFLGRCKPFERAREQNVQTATELKQVIAEEPQMMCRWCLLWNKKLDLLPFPED